MKGDPIPDSDHVLRYVRRSLIDEEGAPSGPAFLSRPRDDNSASYNWLEYYSGSDDERLAEIRKRRRLEYRPRDVLAKLNTHHVLSRLHEEFEDCGVAIVHDPLDPDETYELDDQSHALMLNIPAKGEALGEAMGDLIAECVIETFHALAPEEQA